MTDRYADLRAALPVLIEEARLKGGVNSRAQMIIDLLAERDRLREALWAATEHNALHFGESHNTVIQGRAALAQEQGGRDVN